MISERSELSISVAPDKRAKRTRSGASSNKLRTGFRDILIYLIGYGGTGKYTIAKELNRALKGVIVDNQLINAPVFTVIGANGKTPLPLGAWMEICKVREAVYNAMRYLTKPGMNFILTNELFENLNGDNKIYEEVANIAESRGSLFIPVRLTCDARNL